MQEFMWWTGWTVEIIRTIFEGLCIWMIIGGWIHENRKQKT